MSDEERVEVVVANSDDACTQTTNLSRLHNHQFELAAQDERLFVSSFILGRVECAYTLISIKNTRMRLIEVGLVRIFEWSVL